MPLEYRYPRDDEAMNQKLQHLTQMIEEKIPGIDTTPYGMLDHQEGRCDYDAYDRYDAEWHDEAGSFGHLWSEAIPSTY